MKMSAFKIRSSKFRHVYGQGSRKDSCYEGIKICRSSDSNLCAVNPKFVSIITDSAGGGSFIVLPINKFGRVDANAGKVSGHTGPVMDIKWSPFNDNIIASSSEDRTVKVWHIPEGGLHGNLNDWSVDLHGHHKRVDSIEWHPTANNILLSSSCDYKCIVWNTEQAEPVTVVRTHTQPIYSVSWNRDGSLFSTTCKDKMIRVIDPRSTHVAIEAKGHVGPRISKVLFLGDTGKLFSTGFSRMSERQYSIWDIRDMSQSLRTEPIDSSNGLLMPFYDADTKVVFLAGKGDGNIRYYEIVNDASCCHFLDEFHSSYPQKGMGCMPKRGCNPWKCEIMRFYKLHADKSLCEPISMIVPRRAEAFQEDIFPPTNSIIPSCTADQWISGINRDPVLISLKDGSTVGCPKTTTSRAVQEDDGQLGEAPVITTYRALDRKHNKDERFTQQKSFPAIKSSQRQAGGKNEPASIKNIRQLSSDTIGTCGEEIHRGQNSMSRANGATNPSSVVDRISSQEVITRPHQTSFAELNGDIDHTDGETNRLPSVTISPPRLTRPFRPDGEIEIIENEKPGDDKLNQITERSTGYNSLSTNGISDNVTENSDRHYSWSKFKAMADMWNRKLEHTRNDAYCFDGERKPRRSQSLRLPSRRSLAAPGSRPSILDDSTFEPLDKTNDEGTPTPIENGQRESKPLYWSKSLHASRSRSVANVTLTSPVKLDSEHRIHVKKLWPNTPDGENHVTQNIVTYPSNEYELRKAYVKQAQEINGLRVEIGSKDRRIRQLEEELRRYREGSY